MSLVKIEKKSVPILYLIAIVPLIISILSQFEIIDLSTHIPALLTILGAGFVLTEVGIMQMIRKQNLSKDPLRTFGAIVAMIAILGAGLGLLGVSFAILNTIQGLVNSLVALYILILGFS